MKEGLLLKNILMRWTQIW